MKVVELGIGKHVVFYKPVLQNASPCMESVFFLIGNQFWRKEFGAKDSQ